MEQKEKVYWSFFETCFAMSLLTVICNLIVGFGSLNSGNPTLFFSLLPLNIFGFISAIILLFKVKKLAYYLLLTFFILQLLFMLSYFLFVNMSTLLAVFTILLTFITLGFFAKENKKLFFS